MSRKGESEISSSGFGRALVGQFNVCRLLEIQSSAPGIRRIAQIIEKHHEVALGGYDVGILLSAVAASQ